jgi:chromosome segregation ATPase
MQEIKRKFSHQKTWQKCPKCSSCACFTEKFYNPHFSSSSIKWEECGRVGEIEEKEEVKQIKEQGKQVKMIRKGGERLKKEYDRVIKENDELKGELERIIDWVTELYTGLEKVGGVMQRSLRWYFDFIEVFKSLQNVALYEDEISVIRLKFDEITSKSPSMLEFDYEELQSIIASTNDLLTTIPSKIEPIKPHLESLKINVPDLNSPQIFSQTSSDLDALLFSSNTFQNTSSNKSLHINQLTSEISKLASTQSAQTTLITSLKSQIVSLKSQLNTQKSDFEKKINSLASEYAQQLEKHKSRNSFISSEFWYGGERRGDKKGGREFICDATVKGCRRGNYWKAEASI